MSLKSRVSLLIFNILDMKRRKRILETERMNKNLGDEDIDLYCISNNFSNETYSKDKYNKECYEELKASIELGGEDFIHFDQKEKQSIRHLLRWVFSPLFGLTIFYRYKDDTNEFYEFSTKNNLFLEHEGSSIKIPQLSNEIPVNIDSKSKPVSTWTLIFRMKMQNIWLDHPKRTWNIFQ